MSTSITYRARQFLPLLREEYQVAETDVRLKWVADFASNKLSIEDVGLEQCEFEIWITRGDNLVFQAESKNGEIECRLSDFIQAVEGDTHISFTVVDKENPDYTKLILTQKVPQKNKKKQVRVYGLAYGTTYNYDCEIVEKKRQKAVFLTKTEPSHKIEVVPRYVGGRLGKADVPERNETICNFSFDGNFVALALYRETTEEINIEVCQW